MRFEGLATGWTRRQVRLWLTGLGTLVSLAIVGPTFWWEETWDGAPLIDRGGLWWLLPSVVMALGFFLGGVVAGYPRRRVRKAVWQGVVASTATVLVILAADLYRRHSHGESLQVLVGVYWIGALCVAGGVSGLGAYYGRARAIALRRGRST